MPGRVTIDNLADLESLKLQTINQVEVTIRIGPFRIPGIVAAAAYTANDAFGTLMEVSVPKSGVIQSIRLYDLDDEGISTTVLLFREAPATQVDNAPVAITDADLLKMESAILIDTFHDFIDNQIGTEDNLGIAYTAPSGSLWMQCVTRGTPTIAASNQPYLELVLLSDE